MDNAVRVYVIEGSIIKGELIGAAVFHSSQPSNSVARQLKMLLANVHTGRNRTMLCKLQKVTARAAADFKYAFACVLLKFGSLAEPRITAISLLFGEIEWCLIPMRLR